MLTNNYFKTCFIALIFSLFFSSYIAAGEADRNAQIQKRCAEYARNNSYTGGGPQVDPNCEAATSWICLANELCASYPGECHKMKQRAIASCEIVSRMGYTCRACEGTPFISSSIPPDSTGTQFKGPTGPAAPLQGSPCSTTDINELMVQMQLAAAQGDTEAVRKCLDQASHLIMQDQSMDPGIKAAMLLALEVYKNM